MKKKNNTIQTSLVEKSVKQRPILTEEEMKDFCTYDEIVTDALRMFDEKVKNIIMKNGQNNSK